jgi:hypothetical protein
MTDEKPTNRKRLNEARISVDEIKDIQKGRISVEDIRIEVQETRISYNHIAASSTGDKPQSKKSDGKKE